MTELLRIMTECLLARSRLWLRVKDKLAGLHTYIDRLVDKHIQSL